LRDTWKNKNSNFIHRLGHIDLLILWKFDAKKPIELTIGFLIR
jgi:hypothetical protein